MKVRLISDLLIINILSLLLVVIIVFLPSNPLRILFGLPFVLLFPGYTVVSALFPKKSALGDAERVALSFGLSIAIVPLLGLILNYSPWGIRVHSVLVSLALLTLVASVVAWYQRRRLPVDESFFIVFNINLRHRSLMRPWDKVLSIVLVASMLVAIVAIVYAVVAPPVGERFTEFYILGPDGKADNYPKKLTLGEEGKVILGIVNNESENMTYSVEIKVGDEGNSTIGPLSLVNKEKWENEVEFTPAKAGKNQKVEFVLFRLGEAEPYRTLHLWVSVGK